MPFITYTYARHSNQRSVRRAFGHRGPVAVPVRTDTGPVYDSGQFINHQRCVMYIY